MADGMLVTTDEGTFFVPKTDLEGYRLGDEAAAAAHAAMGEGEVEGFAQRPAGLKPTGPTVGDIGFSGPARGPVIKASYWDMNPTSA